MARLTSFIRKMLSEAARNMNTDACWESVFFRLFFIYFFIFVHFRLSVHSPGHILKRWFMLQSPRFRRLEKLLFGTVLDSVRAICLVIIINNSYKTLFSNQIFIYDMWYVSDGWRNYLLGTVLGSVSAMSCYMIRFVVDNVIYAVD